MLETWKKISNIGASANKDHAFIDPHKLTFFNKALFIGLIFTLFHTVFIWPILGPKALVFLFISATISFCFYLNSIGKFVLSKRLLFAVVYSSGAYTAALLGSSGYYHLQAFSTFTFALILFDLKKEKLEILLGVPILIFILLIAELNLFDSPDLSNHPWIQVHRYANIFGLITVNTLITLVILRINKRNEIELEQGKTQLETIVRKRTSEIQSQKNILLKRNSEKDLLLKEVHHRVKNNLQIITSLINLQMSQFDDSKIQEALQDTKSRVLSMSLVHKKMYQDTDVSKIRFRDYLEQLMDNIEPLYPGKLFLAQIDIPDDIYLDVETAIPTGLIMNEILSNFYKHAYVDDRQNIFSVSAKRDTENIVLIRCRDNGEGFQENLKSDLIESLGLNIIESLIEQLEGELKYYNSEGAVYEFSIRCKARVLV